MIRAASVDATRGVCINPMDSQEELMWVSYPRHIYMAVSSVKFPFMLQRKISASESQLFLSCLQSCDALDTAKNELLQQSLGETLEKDLAYLFYRGKK